MWLSIGTVKNSLPLIKGSVSKLNNDQTQALIAHLKEHTYLTVIAVIDYVDRVYGVLYSLSGMTAWLKANHFRYKKPKAVPPKKNALKEAEFLTQLTQLVQSNELIFYLDSTHPTHQSKLVYGWIYQGTDKSLPTTVYQQRIHLTGALECHQKSVIIAESETINAKQSSI